jgi:integrase
MLRAHKEEVLGPLVGAKAIYLFDTGRGRPKGEPTISWLIERTIKRHLGVEMTAHQFRHLAAKVLLDANPGAYEVVRQLLGHANLKTTVNSYTGLNTRRAGRVHAELIERARAATRESAPVRSKRKQS